MILYFHVSNSEPAHSALEQLLICVTLLFCFVFYFSKKTQSALLPALKLLPSVLKLLYRPWKISAKVW